MQIDFGNITQVDETYISGKNKNHIQSTVQHNNHSFRSVTILGLPHAVH